MTEVASALEQTRRSEQRRAARALLARPLLASRGTAEADYRLVRRHEQVLRDWFDQETGWRLTVDSSAARLHKRVSGDDPTRGLVDHHGRPLNRRRYVLLCLALAVLERTGGQTVLGRLADDVLAEHGDPRFATAGLDYALLGRDERSDMVVVVRLLLDLGVLRRRDGDEGRFVAGTGDVLYDVDHGVLAGVLAAAAAPSTVADDTEEGRIAAITEGPLDAPGDARTRGLRRTLTRRLLDDAVVYGADRTEEERAYLLGQRRAMTARIEQFTGLVPEIRAEGIAMVDPEDDLSDVRMPEGGAPGHLALLLAERLSAAGRLSRRELEAVADALREEHAHHWGVTIRARPVRDLVEEAAGRLRALALVRFEGDDVVAVPALARYRTGAPRVAGSVP